MTEVCSVCHEAPADNELSSSYTSGIGMATKRSIMGVYCKTHYISTLETIIKNMKGER